MSFVKGAMVILSIFLYMIFCLLIYPLMFFWPVKRLKLTSRCTMALSTAIRRIIGIKIQIKGNLSYFKENGNFIASNHVSYLDGIILSSLFPVLFVTRLQVRSWPVFGWMSRLGGTIFVDRQKKTSSAGSITRISGILKKKINVLFFPECTSTNGSLILPFRSGCFQAPLNSGSDVVCATIQYLTINSQPVTVLNRDKVFWYAQVPFGLHLLQLLRQKEIVARVTIHPKIYCGDMDSALPSSRKILSRVSMKEVQSVFCPVT